MLRNKALAQLQKTYDDSYLSCSKAVFYEGQGNEDDAMRCWRTALDQIKEHPIGRGQPGDARKSETEEALKESLRELEIQCLDRINLLEALRLSREEDHSPKERSSTGKLTKAPSTPDPMPRQKGWIGDGTIPAITYPELSRPILPPRPPLPPRSSSDLASFGSSSSNLRLTRSQSPQIAATAPMGTAGGDKTLRSPSPEKHKMRTTLRPAKSGDKAAKPIRKYAAELPEGPSKAATAAWSALSSRESPARRPAAEPLAGSTTTPGPRSMSEHLHKPSASPHLQWDSHTRRLVGTRESDSLAIPYSLDTGRNSDEYPYPRPSLLSISAASSALNAVSSHESSQAENIVLRSDRVPGQRQTPLAVAQPCARSTASLNPDAGNSVTRKSASDGFVRRKLMSSTLPGRDGTPVDASESETPLRPRYRERQRARSSSASSASDKNEDKIRQIPGKALKGKQKEAPILAISRSNSPDETAGEDEGSILSTWKRKRAAILKNLPAGVDEAAAKQILNEIVVQGDEVHWSDVAGLDIAKNALRENVVYPFLRPDLFMGLREPARGMLLFGPPGTGKTMLARAVATESRSTFFSISASSLTSKYLGESEKLVRALFALAKSLAPSIIFVDEIDSLLSQRSGSGEHEATRRIKTEFLIQWSDLQRAAAGRDVSEKERERGDASRVLVLAATNLPWAIDEAARRRFVRRQYIPLPEPKTRATQLRTLLGQQKHTLSDADIEKLVELTDGFSGSDITALAKDAAMGPLRSLGEALLHMTMDQIRPIELVDFLASLSTIRPSVSKAGLKEYEDWAKEFGERGG